MPVLSRSSATEGGNIGVQNSLTVLESGFRRNGKLLDALPFLRGYAPVLPYNPLDTLLPVIKFFLKV